MRASVLDGRGIAGPPPRLFEDLVEAAEVEVPSPDRQTSALQLSVVRPPQRRHAAKLRGFSDHLPDSLVALRGCR